MWQWLWESFRAMKFSEQLTAGLTALGIAVAIGGFVIAYFAFDHDRRTQKETLSRLDAQAQVDRKARLDADFQAIASGMANGNSGVRLVSLSRLGEFRSQVTYAALVQVLLEEALRNARIVAGNDFTEWTQALARSTTSLLLPELDLRRADLRGADLRGADLSAGTDSMVALGLGMDAMTAEFARRSAAFQGRNLTVGADFEGALLSGADLSEVHLNLGNFRGANLSATSDRPEDWNGRTRFQKAILTGVYARGVTVRNAVMTQADLRGSEFSFANLSLSDLTLADARGVKLSGANLDSTNLNMANLGNADLSRASLRSARLMMTNLSGAVLSGADLRGAILQNEEQGFMQVPVTGDPIPETTKKYLVEVRRARVE